MATSEKEQRVRELTEAIARSKSIVLANFTGMNVEMVTKMRRRLRDAHVEFIVEKNTLAKRALAESGTLVLGHSKRDTLDIPAVWHERKMLKHGDSVMRFLQRKS